MPELDALFSPVRRRNTVIPSRLLLAPINTGLTSRNLPSARLLHFHRERSGLAIGISMVGNVAVEAPMRTNVRTAILRKSQDLPRYAALARAISRRGSLPGIQLASAPTNLQPHRRWRTTDTGQEERRLRGIIRSYTDDDLDEHLARFLHSGSLAKRAGYDVVQIHSAHGYLLSLLLHPAINSRAGRYGPEKPWFEEFVSQMRSAIGDGLLSIRLSALTGLSPEDEEIEWTRSIMNRAVGGGVDIIDLSAGFYTVDRRLIYPGRNRAEPVYANWLDTLTHDLSCLVAIAGRITDLRTVLKRLTPNLLVSVGRPLIADPAFASKMMNGQYDLVNACTLTNKCHYFSRGKTNIECGVNPDL